jgi:transposase
MKQLYNVELTAAQRQQLEKIVRKGQANIHVFNHARVLLKAADKTNDQQIAQAVGISSRTVQRTRQRFCQEGLERALYQKPRSGAPKKIDGGQKAAIVALACTTPPPGHAHWSLRLLAAKSVELAIVESICYVTVGEILKKTISNPGENASGVLAS